MRPLGPERLFNQFVCFAKHRGYRFGADEVRDAAAPNAVHLFSGLSYELCSDIGIEPVNRVRVEIYDRIEIEHAGHGSQALDDRPVSSPLS